MTHVGFARSVVLWRNVNFGCYAKLNARAPYVHGKFYLDSEGAFNYIREEIRNGKTPT